MQFFIASQEQSSLSSTSRVLTFWPTWTILASPSRANAGHGTPSSRLSTVRISSVASSSSERTHLSSTSPSFLDKAVSMLVLSLPKCSTGSNWFHVWSPRATASYRACVNVLLSSEKVRLRFLRENVQVYSIQSIFDRCQYRSQKEATQNYTVT